MVGIKALTTSKTAEVYLAVTICKSDNGLVRSNSIVPDFCSSANIFIVIAGMRKRKRSGARIKNESKFAYPFSIILKSVAGKTQIIKPVAHKKTRITTYPVIELKKLLISFLKSEYKVNLLWAVKVSK